MKNSDQTITYIIKEHRKTAFLYANFRKLICIPQEHSPKTLYPTQYEHIYEIQPYSAQQQKHKPHINIKIWHKRYKNKKLPKTFATESVSAEKNPIIKYNSTSSIE